MKKKSKELRKLERNRYSVFYEDLGTCMNCGSTYCVTKHEIFEGKNRQNSMIYGFVLPLCLDCHRELQEHSIFSLKWKIKSQQYFEDYIGTREDFISIFRRNYL